MKDSSDQRRLVLGIVQLVIAVAIFGCVDGISKLLAETQSVGQIVWARYALALPVIFITTPPSQWIGMFRTRLVMLQVARGLMPIGVSIGMVVGVHHLPLADATVILFAGPFIVVALSTWFLGEHVRLASWIGVIVGFVAVLIVARPGFGEVSKYTAFPAFAALFYALMMLITRRLGAAGERPLTTLAWMIAVGALISTPIAFVGWVPVAPRAWALMLALGTIFGIGHRLMARAFSLAAASVLAPFTYVQIISAVIFGYLVFGAIPDVWTMLGIAMIIGAGLYVVRSGEAPRPAMPSPSPLPD